MTAKEFNKLLSRIFKDITKQNGEESKLSSLTSFQIFKPPTPDVRCTQQTKLASNAKLMHINLDDSVKVHSASNI